MEPRDALIVLTTWPANSDPAGLAVALVTERLAACVSVLPEMESVYEWEGKLQREPERQVVIKTTIRRLDALERRLRELHPYEVPEVLALRVDEGGAAYLAWLRSATDGVPGTGQS